MLTVVEAELLFKQAIVAKTYCLVYVVNFIHPLEWIALKIIDEVAAVGDGSGNRSTGITTVVPAIQKCRQRILSVLVAQLVRESTALPSILNCQRATNFTFAVVA